MNKRYNIAFLTHGDRNVGGGEQSWYFLINKLDRNLFRPIIFFSKKNRIITRLEQEQIPIVNIDLNPRITSIYRDQVRFNPFSLCKYFFYLSQAIWKLFRLLKKNEIHILHAHDNLSKIIGVPAAKLARIKIITNCNDQLGSTLIDRFLLFYQCHFMDKIFCVTRYVGNTFAKKGNLPSNVCVVYSAIEPDRWKRKNKENRNKKVVLGIVAVFDKVKGHIVLFRAIKILVSRGITHFTCLVIGEGRERASLHQFVLEHGIGEYVQFRGFVHDLKKALNELDILIAPSIQESFGLAPVEAMAMGIPVIASRVGGLPEVVLDGETGLLVPSSNSEALADAIVYLMDRPEVRQEMGKKGRERVLQKFDIDKNLKISEKMILDLLNEESN